MYELVKNAAACAEFLLLRGSLAKLASLCASMIQPEYRPKIRLFFVRLSRMRMPARTFTLRMQMHKLTCTHERRSKTFIEILPRTGSDVDLWHETELEMQNTEHVKKG